MAAEELYRVAWERKQRKAKAEWVEMAKKAVELILGWSEESFLVRIRNGQKIVGRTSLSYKSRR